MKWHLDEDAAALLHTMTGTDDEPTTVTLFVGASQDDDGKPVYGLHAYETEYPEEGCVPLVEFEEQPDHSELLQRIREAVGDPTGKLMQDELVARIAALASGVPTSPVTQAIDNLLGDVSPELRDELKRLAPAEMSPANANRLVGLRQRYAEKHADGVLGTPTQQGEMQ